MKLRFLVFLIFISIPTVLIAQSANLYSDSLGTSGYIGNERVDLYNDSFGTSGTIGGKRVNCYKDSLGVVCY